jgi:hypothetical protein
MLRTLSNCLLLCLALGGGGCANFKAASEFAKETTQLSSTVRNEFTQMDRLCAQQAEVVIVVNDIRDDGPLKDCEQYKNTLGRLAAVTVDVLDNYAQALSGLANDAPFVISDDLNGVAGKLQGLRDRNGAAIVDSKEVTALSKVIGLLFDLAAAAKREEGIKRLADESPNLALSGQILRSYFIESADAPPGRAKAPYSNLVAIAGSSFASTEVSLRSPALSKAEPIRTAELYRDLQKRKEVLNKRTGNSANRVAAKMAAAIDAWQAALAQFADNALKAEPKDLLARIKELRLQTLEAKKAVDAAN